MITKSGRSARIICRNREGFEGKFPVLMLVKKDNGDEIAVPYSHSLECAENQWFPNEDLSIDFDASLDAITPHM